MAEHAFPFKVMRDAIDLRQHIVRQMEQAEAAAGILISSTGISSFIVVGAGFQRRRGRWRNQRTGSQQHPLLP